MVNIRSLLYKKLSIIWFQWCKKTWRQHVLDYAAFGTMQLGFIIFYKIISLRSVPHNQARPTANPPSPINCCKQIQNWAVLALFYARMQRFFYRLWNPLSFYSGVFPTADIITWRGKQSFPLQPPTHLKCSFLGLRLGMKAIRATHTQARTIITVLDFLLAQNTPPVALWAYRRRFFAPRDFARPEIR